MRIKKMLGMAFVLVTAISAMSVGANAAGLEYEYSSTAPGATFHISTSTDQNHVGEADQLVIGMDGTITNNIIGDASSSPLSVLDIPIGEYPDAWGETTDLAIANNTYIPNELGPTFNNSAYYRAVYTPIVMNGALPTAAGFAPAGVNGYGGIYNTVSNAMYGTAASAAVSVNSAVASGGAAAAAAGGNGAVAGVATQNIAMPTITDSGAIGQLSIPSIGLNKYIYEGTSTSNMQKGIAHFDSTSGWQGNVALAGHNRGNYAYFGKLKDVQIGDTVVYKTAYGTATYQVSAINERATTDTSGLAQDGTNKLTMYTCKANQPDVKLEVVASLVSVS